ncbi:MULTISPECIES: hypothetical protein [unclassified Pseudomonas]|uniref:hypothetical protein n=1 Tax=Pseudomonas sp. A-R-26 TaxID=2832404 RepID=UPI001CBE694D|nr:hypothetical protein [Pseudomonas sp. A-R-26]
MSILLPSVEESQLFFEKSQIAPLAQTPRIRGFSAMKKEGVDQQDLLLGNETPAVIGFSDNLDEDKKQAAADSIHFAERYATTYSDIKAAPVEWHAKYSEAMRHCGWTLTSSKYKDHVNKQVNVTMDSIVLDIITAVAGRNAPAMLKLLQGAFDKIQSEESLVTLFDNNSNKGKNAEFRIVPCLQSAKGTAITAYLAVDCELDTQEGGAWFWKWKLSNLKMKKVATMAELDMRTHERNRELIYEVLDMSSEEFFRGVKLK